ncbi:unnamed protein product [Lepidochelys olivacea]
MDTWRLEGTQYPPCNCQKSPTPRVVVALIVVSSPLIAAIIALAVLTSQLSSADLCPPAGPSCPDGWMGYRGKCYYFSEMEGSWTDNWSWKGAGPTTGPEGSWTDNWSLPFTGFT